MSERAMAAAKVLGMVLLVVVPGGSLVLLAIAAYRAYQRGSGPFAWLTRPQLRKVWVASLAALTRLARLPLHWVPHRA